MLCMDGYVDMDMIWVRMWCLGEMIGFDSVSVKVVGEIRRER